MAKDLVQMTLSMHFKLFRMDKIQKVLRTLSQKEREAIGLLMLQLKTDYTKVPGIVALQGMKGWFRVRMGRYRIIISVDPETKSVEIRRLTKRDESTYKRLK
jgi:mRNA-degrading endonuclease RelE of RelBE toxin-antitoxin system